jgi:hypothetical protein
MKHSDSQPDTEPFDLDRFTVFCVGAIARGADYATYDAAFMRVIDVAFPPPAEGDLRDDPDLRRRLGRVMSRVIWKQTPHPAHRYAPAPLPASERNAPCHCGSGIKYKQCCQSIEHGLPIERMNLLPNLLDALPRKRWGELPGSRIDRDAVAHAAHEWSEQGRDKDTLALLEPWFADDARFDARHELLFDLLLDAYTNAGKPRKKSALLDRAMKHGDRTLRSAAMQRRVSMLADEGEFPAAWKLFAEAQRYQPESPSLSHLEVTLLLGEGREAEARERARFWVLRLERLRDPGLSGLIDLLRNVAEHGGSAMLNMALGDDQEVTDLLELWRSAPAVAVHYELTPQGDSAGPLLPSLALQAALQQWDEVFPGSGRGLLQQGDNDDVWIAAPVWLPVLRAQPILWNTFEVLDALVYALNDIPALGVDGVLDALLERAGCLLREVIRANQADGLKLEWGWMENRAALRLLGSRLARELRDASTPEHLTRLEWLVCTLNPNDNQGFRDALMRRYLEVARFADALALADRYPHDMAPMRYNRALALYALERVALATFALRDAVTDSPKLLAWLLKRNPKPPRMDPLGVHVGGDDEAFIYRDEHLALWKSLGALEWARHMDGARRR